MKQVIYKGQDTHLGVHGDVKHGQKIGLSYDEWLSVRGDERFVPVPTAAMASAEKILPSATAGYDLTGLPWGEVGIGNKLRKLRKSTLIKVAIAMKEIGIDVEVNEHMTGDNITDEVLFAADHAGWMD